MESCPHVRGLESVKNEALLTPRKWCCVVCGTTDSVWACLQCPNIACGRFNEEHAVNHFNDKGHPLALEINKKYLYCYECDSYVFNDNSFDQVALLRETLKEIETQVFNESLTRSGHVIRGASTPVLDTEKRKKDQSRQEDQQYTAICHWRLNLLSKVFNAIRKDARCTKDDKRSIASNEEVAKKAEHVEPPRKRRKVIIPGVTGLRNLGNTCYMNSVLQVLSHLQFFRQCLLLWSEIKTAPDQPSLTSTPKNYVSLHAIYQRQTTVECYEHVSMPLRKSKTWPKSRRERFQVKNPDSNNKSSEIPQLNKSFTGSKWEESVQQFKENTPHVTKLTTKITNKSPGGNNSTKQGNEELLEINNSCIDGIADGSSQNKRLVDEDTLHEGTLVTENAYATEVSNPATHVNKCITQVNNLGTQVNNSETQVNNSETQVNNPGTQVNDFQTQVNNSRTNVNNSETQVNDPGTQVNNSETQVNKSETQVNNPETQVNNPGTQVNNSGTNVNNSGMNVNNSETQVNDPGTRVNNSEMHVNNSGTNVNNSGTNVNNSGTQVNNSGTQVSSSEKPVNLLETQVNNSETEVNNLETQENNSGTYVDSSESQLNNVATETTGKTSKVTLCSVENNTEVGKDILPEIGKNKRERQMTTSIDCPTESKNKAESGKKKRTRMSSDQEHNKQVYFSDELHALFRVMWSGKWAIVTPLAVLHAVWDLIPSFLGYSQHDAQEFLCEVLERLQSELEQHCPINSNGPMDDVIHPKDILPNAFEGKLVSEVMCHNCRNISTTREQFWDLSLEFPDRYQVKPRSSRGRLPPRRPSMESCHLTELLAKFTQNETLEGRSYRCEKCCVSPSDSLQFAQKQLQIAELPEVLRLHLKRFRWYCQTRGKIISHVGFDMTLDMKPYCHKLYSVNYTDQDFFYKLSAVIIHLGTGFDCGHYVAYCWNEHADSWVYYNDARVSLCCEEDVLKSQAYILLYTRYNGRTAQSNNFNDFVIPNSSP